MKYKTITCGRCLCEMSIDDDMHPETWRCPTCGQVQGVSWNQFDGERDVSNRLAPMLEGEGVYDWDWLNYDSIAGAGVGDNAFDQDNDYVNENLGWD